MTIEVRRATAADVDCICEFNRLVALETEAKALDLELLKSGVAAVLADANRGLYFIAQENKQLVGQMGLTYEWSDWRNGWFWWLQSVYVRAEARRRGVCGLLVEHIREAARAEGDVIGLRLYVERGNTKAQATYHKMGLEFTTYQVMEQYPLPI